MSKSHNGGKAEIVGEGRMKKLAKSRRENWSFQNLGDAHFRSLGETPARLRLGGTLRCSRASPGLERALHPKLERLFTLTKVQQKRTGTSLGGQRGKFTTVEKRLSCLSLWIQTDPGKPPAKRGRWTMPGALSQGSIPPADTGLLRGLSRPCRDRWVRPRCSTHPLSLI